MFLCLFSSNARLRLLLLVLLKLRISIFVSKFDDDLAQQRSDLYVPLSSGRGLLDSHSFDEERENADMSSSIPIRVVKRGAPSRLTSSKRTADVVSELSCPFERRNSRFSAFSEDLQPPVAMWGLFESPSEGSRPASGAGGGRGPGRVLRILLTDDSISIMKIMKVG